MTSFQTMLTAEVPALQRFAMRLARNRDEADDLVQDCLIRALEKHHLFQPGSNLRAWLFTMMSNLFISGKRSAASRMVVPLDPEMEEWAPPSQLDHLRLRELEGALGRLRPEQRAVVMLVGVEGLHYRHAALRLGIPIGTVRSRLARARAALAHALDGIEGIAPAGAGESGGGDVIATA
jgi:RNA polymerase sigma-70 factor, ECF subfamily